MATQTKSTIK